MECVKNIQNRETSFKPQLKGKCNSNKHELILLWMVDAVDEIICKFTLLLQITSSMLSAFGGPMTGIFLLAIFCPSAGPKVFIDYSIIQ